MKNSREFKRECVGKDFNGLSEMLLDKNSAEQILGEDGVKLSNVAKAKVLAKRSQIIAEVLREKQYAGCIAFGENRYRERGKFLCTTLFCGMWRHILRRCGC